MRWSATWMAAVIGALMLQGCSSCGGTSSTPGVIPPPALPTADELPAPPAGPLPALLMVQAQFTTQGDRPVPGPAKLVIVETDGAKWYQQTIEDPESNVFHKAMAWRDGILTIGGDKARLILWKKDGAGWKPDVLWEREWGGKFNRMRDVEIGDVDGDGKDNIVIATHDSGVVAVGVEQPSGSWSFHELDKTPDTFVHEIEIGDIDGDGKMEFYATPSARNRASGESQPGAVARYSWIPGGPGACPTCGAFARTLIAQWDESHAKEILVSDVDGDGKPELYAVREAHTEVDPTTSQPKIIDPVRVVRLDPAPEGQMWKETVVATIQDRQCRVLVPADLDGDGKTDLVAAGYKSGIWRLVPKGDGTFDTVLIDADATGFENATTVADFDKDGKPEIYVAADDQHELRRYVWNGTGFDKTVIAKIPNQRITWNLTYAVVP